MLTTLILASGAALAAWASILVLPWQPHRTRERLEPERAAEPATSSDLTVLIPARNEAAVIERTLSAVARQGAGLAAVVVDDQSTDGTRELLHRFAARHSGLELRIVQGEPLPAGWAGKLWALEQGRAHADRAYTLLLDADIELAPGTVPALLEIARARGAALVSVMAQLHCRTFWERLLVPPFVFFFKLLYPFALVNDPRSRTAGAAGGCMLVRTDILRELGGFAAIRGALIDDCAMAAAVKARGEPIWLGLSRSVRSLRGYDGLADFWQMVSRSAFTQLRYSTPLLVLVTALMAVMFAAPLAAFAVGGSVSATGALGVLAMCAAYAPIVRFYRLPLAWTLTLPIAALLFLAMTWSSAIGYWRGRRATWKNRVYEAAD